jgi:hypothetical protein
LSGITNSFRCRCARTSNILFPLRTIIRSDENPKPYRRECQRVCQRLYCHACPHDDGSWGHLYPQAMVETDFSGRVIFAWGFADCEFCEQMHLCSWAQSGFTLTTHDGLSNRIPLDEIYPAS